jgi:transposase-like protein
MEEKHKIRIEAVRRFLSGERPVTKVYRSLNKNKQWFYFWLNRYQQG